MFWLMYLLCTLLISEKSTYKGHKFLNNFLRMENSFIETIENSIDQIFFLFVCLDDDSIEPEFCFVRESQLNCYCVLSCLDTINDDFITLSDLYQSFRSTSRSPKSFLFLYPDYEIEYYWMTAAKLIIKFSYFCLSQCDITML